MSDLSSKAVFEKVKSFLELVQPLSVKYGYQRGVSSGASFITYYNMGTTLKQGLGNSLISETKTFVVTIQTKTMEQNMLYRDLIVRGTEKTEFSVVSEDLRKDVTVDAGWINTIVLRIYNSLSPEQVAYTAEQVRAILQEIADRYILLTNIYKPGADIIDRFIVPPLEDRLYDLAEVIALKQEYLDKLLLKVTEY